MSLETLLDRVRDEAEERREEILARARDEARGVLERAGRRREERREEQRRRVEREARSDARIRLAEARGSARRRLLRVRTAGLDRIFRAASGSLSGAVNSDAYRASLPEVLDAALALLPGEGLGIRCSPGLEETVEAALSELDPGSRAPVESVEGDPSVPAGVRVSAPEGTLTVDASLEAALDRLRPRLAIELVARVEEEAR